MCLLERVERWDAAAHRLHRALAPRPGTTRSRRHGRLSAICTHRARPRRRWRCTARSSPAGVPQGRGLVASLRDVVIACVRRRPAGAARVEAACSRPSAGLYLPFCVDAGRAAVSARPGRVVSPAARREASPGHRWQQPDRGRDRARARPRRCSVYVHAHAMADRAAAVAAAIVPRRHAAEAVRFDVTDHDCDRARRCEGCWRRRTDPDPRQQRRHPRRCAARRHDARRSGNA